MARVGGPEVSGQWDHYHPLSEEERPCLNGVTASTRLSIGKKR